MIYNPVDVFGITCPAGGAFFVCEDRHIQFLGCCASDPCRDGSGDCPHDDVRYSSFDRNKGANITNQECQDPTGDWYTCFDLNKPFFGCCSSNACDRRGCPADDLVAAKLSSNPKSAAAFRRSQTPQTTTLTLTTSTSSRTSTTSNNLGSLESSTPFIGSAGLTTSSGATETTLPSSSESAAGPVSSQSLSKGGTAGVSVGATLALLLLAAAVSFFAVRMRKKRREVVFTGSEPPAPGATTLPPTAPYVSRNSDHRIGTPSRSHSRSHSRSQSPSPSLNSGQRPVLYVVNRSSRQSSVSSNNGNNMVGPSHPSGQNSCLGISAAQSTAHRGADDYQIQPFHHHSERLSELDGVGMPTSELQSTSPASSPITSPVQPRSPVVYRPYRPPPRDYRGVPGSPT